MLAGVLLDRAVLAQQGALKRTILLRTDDPGCGAYEAVLGIAELPPGSSSGKHRHPGVEIGYVLEGSIVLEHEGRPTATLKTGDSVKNDGVHSATNSGSQTAKVLAVYIVEKGKPVAEPVP
jgi:quercetin dioxygenase-like cupin family protein